MSFTLSAGSLDTGAGQRGFSLPTLQLGSERFEAAEIFRRQPQVQTVVGFLARNVAQLGLHAFRRVSDTDRERLSDHPLAELLRRPLPGKRLTPYQLKYRLVADLAIYDTAFVLKVKPDEGPMGLLPVPVPLVTPVEESWIEAPAYKLAVGGQTIEVAGEDMIHIHGYSPEDLTVGESPLMALRDVLLEEYQATKHRQSMWKNGARVSGIIERPAPKSSRDWSDEARTRFIREFRDLYSGDGAHAGGVPILEDGMTYKQAGLDPRAAQYIEARKLTREEVASAYFIPPPLVGILDHATFCLPAESLVTTTRGPVPIVDVQAGDQVWSVVDGELRTKPVTWSGQTGHKPLLTIRTQNRTLECTDNHPVLARRRVRTDNSEHANRRRYRWEHAWVPAGELEVGDIIVTANELPEHGGEVCPTRTVSEGFAEFCGLLMGDGNVMRSRGSTIGVSIARAEHAAYMDHYRSVMVEEFHCAAMGGRGTWQSRERKPITLIEDERCTRFASVSAAAELVALGMDGTAFTKRVPQWVFELNPKLRAAFLRGFLDADGSVDKKGRASFSSANEVMLRQVRELCIGLGVPVTNIRCQKGTTRLPNGRIVSVNQWTFTCSDPGANQIIGSHDPRYVERLENGKPFATGKFETYYAYRDRTGKTPIDPPEGCGHARVVSIESDEEAVPVYDLTVADSHNFIAEGVVVHNSNIREQHKQLYQDTLGPWLTQIDEALETQLVSEFADADGLYLEFNLDEKLRGSFEEQAAMATSAAGAPWMTVNEIRARNNLPSLEGGDELVTPLNVTQGGQASPRDSAPDPAERDDERPEGVESGKSRPVQVKAGVPEISVEAAEESLSQFFARMGRSLSSQLGAKSLSDVNWDRWESELVPVLIGVNTPTSERASREALRAMGMDPNAFDPADMAAWLEENAAAQARATTDTSRLQVSEAMQGEEPSTALRALFAWWAGDRAASIGRRQATHVAGHATVVQARKHMVRPRKTWVVTSGDPRDSHAALNGVSVDVDDVFPNGARWPGDSVLPAEEAAQCRCEITITGGEPEGAE